MIRRPPRSTLFPLHDALPISLGQFRVELAGQGPQPGRVEVGEVDERRADQRGAGGEVQVVADEHGLPHAVLRVQDRKSTRLNSSHANISYAVFCLKKKKKTIQ